MLCRVAVGTEKVQRGREGDGGSFVSLTVDCFLPLQPGTGDSCLISNPLELTSELNYPSRGQLGAGGLGLHAHRSMLLLRQLGPALVSYLNTSHIKLTKAPLIVVSI